MKCGQVQGLLHAYVDEELDLATQVSLDTHVQSCPECTAKLQALQSIRTVLRDSTLSYRAPAALQTRIQQQIRKQSVPRFFTSPIRYGIAASWVLIAVVSWQAALFVAAPSVTDLHQHEVMTNHVRSLLADHATDILSSDRHTVKPWFVGRLDFSPVVVDLTVHGFPLLGGRLDYLGGRPVAALVYTRRQHVVNVFIRPRDPHTINTTPRRDPVSLAAQHGYNLVTWQDGDADYWAISDLNRKELEEIAGLFTKIKY